MKTETLKQSHTGLERDRKPLVVTAESRRSLSVVTFTRCHLFSAENILLSSGERKRCRFSGYFLFFSAAPRMNVHFSSRARQNSLLMCVCFFFKGVVKTQIWQNNKWSERLLRPFMRSTENGAMTTLYVATHPDIEEQNRRGCYFVPSKTLPPPYCRPALKQMNPVAQDRDQCRRLWELSQRLTKLNTTI